MQESGMYPFLIVGYIEGLEVAYNVVFRLRKIIIFVGVIGNGTDAQIRLNHLLEKYLRKVMRNGFKLAVTLKIIDLDF